MKRTKLIILRGNSGAGKSTIAKLLAEEIGNCAVLCPDEFYHNILSQNKNSDHYKISVYESIFLLAKMYLLKYEYNVIIEGLQASIFKLGYYDKYMDLSEKNSVEFNQFVLKSNLEIGMKRNSKKKFVTQNMQAQWYDEVNKSIDLSKENLIQVDQLSPEQACNQILCKI